MSYTYNIIIAGFRYNEVRECIPQFFSEALGRELTLRHNKSNNNDIYNVKASNWQDRTVGYVAKSMRIVVRALMQQKNTNRIRAKVVKADVKEQRLTLAIEGEDYLPIIDWETRMAYKKWVCNCPSIPIPKDLIECSELLEDITDLLDSYHCWNENIRKEFEYKLERFTQLSMFDLSRDMDRERQQLAERMKCIGMTEYEEQCRILINSATKTGGMLCSDGMVMKRWNQLLETHYDSLIMIQEYEHYKVEEVESSLRDFPCNLYEVWVTQRENFICRLRYDDIPRKKMWEFISGVMFVEVMTGSLQGNMMLNVWIDKIDLKKESDDSLLAFKKALIAINEKSDNRLRKSLDKVIMEIERRVSIKYGEKLKPEIRVEAGGNYYARVENQNFRQLPNIGAE